MYKRLVVAAALFSGICSAQAQIVFADNFEADMLGLNYTSFVIGWAVSDGTVDLIGNGFFDFYPSNGKYVDLDGSSGNAGVLSRSLTLTGGTPTRPTSCSAAARAATATSSM